MPAERSFRRPEYWEMPENQVFFRGLLTDETDLTDNMDIAEDGVRREIAETSPGNLPAPRVSALSSVLSV